MDERPWVVLKFGGTSVSTVERWDKITSVLQSRIDEGSRPVLVCSALSGVSNLLEEVIRTAVNRQHEPAVEKIASKYLDLATAMGLDGEAIVGKGLAELKRLALGASLIREVSPRLHARIMAMGELMSTRLGSAYLEKKGLAARWLDARDLLETDTSQDRQEELRFLSADCGSHHDPEVEQSLRGLAEDVLVTQGFIARDPSGDTVLLGRGGSDTSAALVAARIGASRCEIWTDVPGMYTANPKQVPHARLLRKLSYSEAQEIASMGAKVLHPRCLAPVRENRIPLHIRCTDRPEAEGTVISKATSSSRPQVKCISDRSGIMLVGLDTVGMWQQVGFLADAFACFKQLHLSVDVVSTSETHVTVSLDPSANKLDDETLDTLMESLSEYCNPHLIGPCASISLVGRKIRGLLHQLGPAFEAFEEQDVHLVSQAASDLNLTFVVNEDQADRLISELHALLFQNADEDDLFGPPLGKETLPAGTPVDPGAWWRQRREELLEIGAKHAPVYVYDGPTLDEAAKELQNLEHVDNILYSMKANSNADIVARLAKAGLGFECVSPGEIARLFEAIPDLDPQRVLFTPNFAPRQEYADAFERGVRVTLDNLHPLIHWPELFRGREIFVRMDPGHGRGHHPHVHTAGSASKFGVPLSEVDELIALVKKAGARVVGLHAHTGSGIRTPKNWVGTGIFLSRVAERLPDVQVLDLGGGLAVQEQHGQRTLDLQAVDAQLEPVRAANPDMEIWMEPGRYLVGRAGVLLAHATQRKSKGKVNYVGIDTGMNSLIRPALYGSWHEIVNLTRLDEPMAEVANVVGPICESSDTLGHERPLPETQEGDVILIATAGAYGRSMASSYNLREPAGELLLP